MQNACIIYIIYWYSNELCSYAILKIENLKQTEKIVQILLH